MPEWVSKSTYLNQEEMENNATIVYGFQGAKSYNISTIAAILANMQSESTINPGLTEVDGYGGYGLVQWTPLSDLTNACAVLGISPYTDGTVQLTVLDAELKELPGVEKQWYTTSAFIIPYYPSGATPDMIGITSGEFIDNTMNWDVQKLTTLFMVAYERPDYSPDINHIEQRKQNAVSWYKFLSGVDPPVPGGSKYKMPIWMKIRYR